MFEHLKKHRVILVTGPHRSGTTIAARMIAADTGHDFVIEDEIGFSKVQQLALFIQAEYGPLVIQCPFLLPNIHHLGEIASVDWDETCVVMMHRYRKDIEASEEKAKRVDFKMLGHAQKRLYGEQSQRHVSDVKYEGWQLQQPTLLHTLDVGYPSLADHPLWVENRASFRFQHEVRNPEMPQGFKEGMDLVQELVAA
jgi:hypothetical protein